MFRHTVSLNSSLWFYFLAVGHRAKKDKQNNIENKPLVVAKPIAYNNNKIQTIMESDVESKLENVTLSETIETPASG